MYIRAKTKLFKRTKLIACTVSFSFWAVRKQFLLLIHNKMLSCETLHSGLT